MRNTLFVSDLDGTLLTKDKIISPRSLKILNQLIHEGMTFTIATARSYHSCQKMLAPLCLRYPIILYNGALIYDRQQEKALHWEIFESNLAYRYLTWIKELGLFPLVYRVVNGVEQVSWYQTNSYIQNYLNSRVGDPRFFPVANFDELYHGGIFYLTLMGSKEELMPLYALLKNEKQAQIIFSEEIYSPEEYWLEIMPVNASKQSGIEYLKTHYDFEHVVSFGDSLNDLSLFAASDESYAVANANEMLKRQANGVIGHHDADGVALYLHQRWLERE